MADGVVLDLDAETVDVDRTLIRIKGQGLRRVQRPARMGVS